MSECQHAYTVRNTVHFLECEYCGHKLPTGFKHTCETCLDVGWIWVDKLTDRRKECPDCKRGVDPEIKRRYGTWVTP
ncbi:Uncharacterised protein [uncultured archaeon]|nr:Uncharacterised protein [uncultured archaeon]